MEPLRVRVKLCGMTRNEDIAHAVSLGVDAIGLIFYPGSSRYVALEEAKGLLKNLPPFVSPVAVFVDPEKEFVVRIIDELPIHILQFHGNESELFCQQFNKPYLKTIHPTSTAQIEQAIKDFPGASALLLDTPSAVAKGGTGLAFDWALIPKNMSKPYVLAGGLNEFNVVQAMNSCTPYALDLCSSVEIAPGLKDHEKMRRLMAVIRKLSYE